MTLWFVVTLISWLVLAISGFAAAILALVRLRDREQEHHENEPLGTDGTCIHCWSAHGQLHDDGCRLRDSGG